MTIRDRAPKRILRQVIDERLKAGQVLYLECDFTVPKARWKYLLLASRCEPALVIVINTSRNQFILRDDNRRACQVKLRQADHPFMKHNSWIDCGDVHEVDAEEIADQIIEDFGRIKGQIRPAVARQVIGAVKRSMSVAPRHKDIIAATLG